MISVPLRSILRVLGFGLFLFGAVFCGSDLPLDPELERRRALLHSAGSPGKFFSADEWRQNRQPITDSTGDQGADPELIAAAGSGDLAQLQERLRVLPATRIDGQAAGGETALTHAVWFGQDLSVDRLLRSGANPDLRTQGGETALHYAIHRDHPQIVAMLLNGGADFRMADRRGYTPLMVAAGLGRFAVTERLLRLGADAAVQDKTQRTALLHAIRGGHPSVARLLIRGDTMHQTDEAEETALFYAVRKNDLATLNALLEAGGKVNARNRFGETPLMAAAFFDRPEFARRLLSAGADPRLRDEHDVYDAALIARTGGHDDIVDLIESPWWIRWFY